VRFGEIAINLASSLVRQSVWNSHTSLGNAIGLAELVDILTIMLNEEPHHAPP